MHDNLFDVIILGIVCSSPMFREALQRQLDDVYEALTPRTKQFIRQYRPRVQRDFTTLRRATLTILAGLLFVWLVNSAQVELDVNNYRELGFGDEAARYLSNTNNQLYGVQGQVLGDEDDVVAGEDRQYVNTLTSNSFLFFTPNTFEVPPFGYNQGRIVGGLNSSEGLWEKMRQDGTGYVIGLVGGNGHVSAAAQFVDKAHSYDMVPILRPCYTLEPMTLWVELISGSSITDRRG